MVLIFLGGIQLILRRAHAMGGFSVERECYTLVSVEGQTEKAFGVRCGYPSKSERIVVPSRRDLGLRVSDPCRFVAFAPERCRREVRGIGFQKQSIPWNQADEVIVRPFLEGHDPAERYVPPLLDRELREGMRARVAVQDPDDARGSRFANGRPRIVFRVSGVDNDRLAYFAGKANLGRESGALGCARGIVIVIIESALADRDGGAFDQLA
ncbi:MAG: hypothetical protein PVSMB1_01260 [Gemmatimonadaceae bacterium]